MQEKFFLLKNFDLLTAEELAELRSEIRHVKLASAAVLERDDKKGFISKLVVALIFWRRARPIAK